MGTAAKDAGAAVTDQPAASGWPAAGTVTAYAAALAAFGYALMSLYWALGGLLAGSAGASALLVVYGGVNVLLGSAAR